MAEHINPYIAGAPVVEKKMFFGREDVFEWIENSLSGKYVDHILVIHGQRRVGKTSVLKHLSNRLPKRYIPIFIDLQGRVSTTLGRFLGWLAREIVKALNEDSGLSLERPDRQAFESDPDYFEHTFLPEIEDALGNKRLLLTFDEFDTLETTEAQEGLAMPFMAILKRLMDQKKLNFVFSIGSSGRKLENMQAAYTSFFKQALYRKISFLTERDTRDLITKPVKGVIKYSNAAIERIIRITSSHPYFVQLMCHELFSLCQRRDKWEISEEDVESVLDAVIERGTVNLKFVWDEASDLEKWVLASVATFDNGVKLPELEAHLRKHQVRFTRQGLESALLHLREKDVLTENNRFVIHLLRLWLLQNRPMEQVREELEEQNPIVTRLLEIGQEYHAKGEYPRAIENYEDALDVDPDNLEVHLGLGSSHLARGDYGRAASEFEFVLDIASDDVVAQKGYSDAYLALGDSQYYDGKLDEAEYAYQQVLKVNPQHAAALERMAQLHHRRAVAAIIGGQDIALDELQTAVKYSDQYEFSDLVDDLRALVAGKKDLADVLRLWGERAWSLELWEEARELFDAYQRVSGDRETVTNRLHELQPRLRATRMEHLREQATRLQSLDRYQEAHDAWSAYLDLDPENADEIHARIAELETQIAAGAQQLRRSRVGVLALWGTAALVGLLAILWFLPNSALKAAVLGGQTAAIVATPEPTAAPTPAPTAIPLRWTRVNSGLFLPRDQITQVVVHPTDPDIVFAGTQSSGIYKSINGGISWAPAQQGLGGGTVYSLVINPDEPDVLYAGILDAGLYKSEDGGENWHAVNGENEALRSDLWQLTSEVALDPTDPDHLLFESGFGLYESFDGAESWEQIWTAEKCIGASIAFSPDGQWLYRMGQLCNPGNGASVSFSQDGGRSWQEVFQSDEGYGFTSSRFFFDEGTNRVFFLTNDTPYYSQLGDPQLEPYTQDSCQSSSIYGGDNQYYCPGPGFFPSSVASAPGNPDVVYLGGTSLLKSVDGGASWNEVISGLGNAPNQLLINPHNQDIYLATNPRQGCSEESELYRSDSHASAFSLVGDETCILSFGPTAQDVYTFRLRNKILQVSLDGGENFSSTTFTTDMRLSNAGVMDTEDGPMLYAGINDPQATGSKDDFFYSYDLGKTWSPASYPTGHLPGIVLPSPSDPFTTWYAITAQPMKSSNGGATWRYCNLDSGETYDFGYWLSGTSTAIAIHPEDPDQIFVATHSKGLLHGAAQTCNDLQPVSGGLDNDYVNSVAYNPAHPDTVYAGTNGGFYISYDGGETWGQVNEGLLGALSIYSIAVDPVDPTQVYVSTPYGIFQLEDQ